jgi:hypothetical protein
MEAVVAVSKGVQDTGVAIQDSGVYIFGKESNHYGKALR